VTRVWSARGWGRIYVGSRRASAGQADVAGVPGRTRAPPYAPHIWAGYGGCRSARAFEARMRRPARSKNRDRSVTGRPAQAFEGGLRNPVVDALMR
jgi:hypothetical protein